MIRLVLHSVVYLLVGISFQGTLDAQTKITAGIYQVSPVSSNTQCIDVAGPSSADGAGIQIYDCGPAAGSLNQVFQVTPITVNGTPAFQMVSSYSGLCLDVDGASTANGAHLQQWNCGGATSLNQLWTFPAFGSANELVSMNSRRCVDLPGGNTAHGTQVQQWDCGNGQNPNQLWNFRLMSKSTGSGSGPPAAGIPSTFFGMSVLNFEAVSPSISYGSTRTWDAYPSVGWATLNPSRGVYNFTNLDRFIASAKARGVDVLYTFGQTPDWASSNTNAATPNGSTQCAPPTNMSDLGNFAHALATHVNGAIKMWEVWNEPQYSYCGSMAALVTMTQQIHDQVKAVDSSSLIVSPAGAMEGGPPLLTSFLAAGGGQYVDVIAYHGYGLGSDEAVVDTLESYKMVMQQNGIGTKPLWDTESSWQFANSASSSSLESAYLAKSYLLHWSNGVSRFWWYAWDGGYWGGLWDSGSGNYPAATAYAQVSKWMVGATLSTPCAADANGIWTCGFTRSGNYKAVAIWNPNGPMNYTVPAGYMQYHDLTGAVTKATAGSTLVVNNTPVLLETGSVF